MSPRPPSGLAGRLQALARERAQRKDPVTPPPPPGRDLLVLVGKRRHWSATPLFGVEKLGEHSAPPQRFGVSLAAANGLGAAPRVEVAGPRRAHGEEHAVRADAAPLGDPEDLPRLRAEREQLHGDPLPERRSAL